jgi:serine/threonine-protein kinase
VNAPLAARDGGSAEQTELHPQSPVADRVAELVASDKHLEAAALCVQAGDHARASELLELACQFADAGREALRGGDARRAVHLAALGGDEALAESALDAIVAHASREAALATAGDLAARGFARHAGELFGRLEHHLEAARAFAAAHEACRAAAAFERAGRAADGARVLEAALRARPGDAEARLTLARLLARHGRTEAAVKALQQIDISAPERLRGLPLLARSLDQLGLEEAARSVRDEMDRLGVSEQAEDDGASPRGSTSVSPARVAEGDPKRRSPTGAAGSVPPLKPAGALLFGRYELVREVAMTPHARVVEAIDRISAERVAVKILAASAEGAGRDALLRFEREANALAQLRHPHVVPLLGYLHEGPAMVLAWMPGGSLADLLEREPIAPERAIEIACSILSALGEAHRLGILHRDIKPANVMFDEAGTARLSDFGAAHLGDLSSTATAGAIGTFAYMSPEQRLGRPATVASDLYGVGALLIEMITGSATAAAVDGQLATPPSTYHPDLLPAHDGIIALLLDEDPRRRPADAFDAGRALRSVRWSDRVPPRDAAARPKPARPSTPAPSKRPRLTVTFDVGDGRDASQRRRDTWINRDVLVVPLDDDALTRARAFAQAGHAALATVLRIDPAANEIWIAPPRGRSLADAPRALSPGQVARLEEAVLALHAAQGAHGAIEPDHLYWHDGEVTLAYPRRAAGKDAAERDTIAVARLKAALSG